MGSLSGFETLKHIRANFQMFCERGFEWTTEEDQLIDQVFDYDDEYVPKPLVTILPTSLETLVIVGAFPDQTTKRFSGLLKLRETRLPKLRAITFENSRKVPVNETTKACCKDCGITLSCS